MGSVQVPAHTGLVGIQVKSWGTIKYLNAKIQQAVLLALARASSWSVSLIFNLRRWRILPMLVNIYQSALQGEHHQRISICNSSSSQHGIHSEIV